MQRPTCNWSDARSTSRHLAHQRCAGFQQIGAPDAGRIGNAGRPTFEGVPLFLLLFTGNYQRQGGLSPQESSNPGRLANEKTAG
jgi:hypothetical protein